MNISSQVIVLVLFGAIAAALIVWHYSRARSLLEHWADERGFNILDSQYRYLRRGPFFWTTSKGQAVYFVRVRDRLGDLRTGYVRCGSWFLGLLSDKVEVRWETWGDSSNSPGNSGRE
jgi:hypothetical protein